MYVMYLYCCMLYIRMQCTVVLATEACHVIM